MSPVAMQVWRGKGDAHEFKLRLIEVQGFRVVFERIAVPAKYNLAAGLRVMFIPQRCTIDQLMTAFEYEREATEEDLHV